ncbi:MAG: hypothetical protein ABW178_03170 [Pseudoxanthomonas sp.]
MNTHPRFDITPAPFPEAEDEGWPHGPPGEWAPAAQAGDPPPRLDEEMPAQLG